MSSNKGFILSQGKNKIPLLLFCSYCGQKLEVDWNDDMGDLAISIDVSPCPVCLETVILKKKNEKGEQK